jgi:nucleoside-diphosphate-sugar epimerase
LANQAALGKVGLPRHIYIIMSDSFPKRLFCFGLGYSALALARVLRQEGWSIAGTSREPDKVEALSRDGIAAYRFDGETPVRDAMRALAGTTHLLISVPPGEAGDPVLHWHKHEITVLMQAVPRLAWLGYLSTTGVYGNRQGDWVDETSERRPSGERGRRRVAAEDGWLALWRDRGLPVHLFRLAGIYGPGRSALDTVRSGKAQRIDKPGQVFSRIHVEDIVAVLRASIERPRAGAVYNLCDDNPAPPEEVIRYACELLGVPPPPLVPFEQAELSPMARSFYDDNTRVRNALIKTELGVRLRFPDYRVGHQALLRQTVP